MKAQVAWVGGALAVVLAGIQLVPVERTNPPVESEVAGTARGPGRAAPRLLRLPFARDARALVCPGRPHLMAGGERCARGPTGAQLFAVAAARRAAPGQGHTRSLGACVQGHDAAVVLHAPASRGPALGGGSGGAPRVASRSDIRTCHRQPWRRRIMMVGGEPPRCGAAMGFPRTAPRPSCSGGKTRPAPPRRPTRRGCSYPATGKLWSVRATEARASRAHRVS